MHLNVQLDGSSKMQIYFNFDKLFSGHLNIVALSGTSIDADDDIRPIDPVDRNCLFPDEIDHMNIYKACIWILT